MWNRNVPVASRRRRGAVPGHCHELATVCPTGGTPSPTTSRRRRLSSHQRARSRRRNEEQWGSTPSIRPRSQAAHRAGHVLPRARLDEVQKGAFEDAQEEGARPLHGHSAFVTSCRRPRASCGAIGSSPHGKTLHGATVTVRGRDRQVKYTGTRITLAPRRCRVEALGATREE